MKSNTPIVDGMKPISPMLNKNMVSFNQNSLTPTGSKLEQPAQYGGGIGRMGSMMPQSSGGVNPYGSRGEVNPDYGNRGIMNPSYETRRGINPYETRRYGINPNSRAPQMPGNVMQNTYGTEQQRPYPYNATSPVTPQIQSQRDRMVQEIAARLQVARRTIMGNPSFQNMDPQTQNAYMAELERFYSGQIKQMLMGQQQVTNSNQGRGWK